jgi:hypothetical protein
MTLLELIQGFCRRQGLPIPNTAYNSTEAGVIQLVGLLEEIGVDSASRGFWESLVAETTWTSVATESQGNITTLASDGFRYILNKTIWDRTQQLPIYGPLNPQEWQGLKAMVVSGPQYQYRIRGGLLLINPVMPAGHTLAFEYVSSNWVTDDSVNYSKVQSDDSTFRIPDDVLLVGLRWKWKYEKGYDYTEDFNSFERMINDSLARSGGGKDIHMDDRPEGPTPGIYVPWGNWLQP